MRFAKKYVTMAWVVVIVAFFTVSTVLVSRFGLPMPDALIFSTLVSFGVCWLVRVDLPKFQPVLMRVV